MTTVREMIAEELARLALEDEFDEGFWQHMFDLGGRKDYLYAKEQRRNAAHLAAREAASAERNAITVEEKRAARKLMKRAKVLAGLERLYARDGRQDPLVKAYQEESKWIVEARDLGVYLQRWRIASSK